MVFIDLLIQTTSEKFNLGNKSIAIISALVATMNRQETGGLENFLAHFHRAGLTDHIIAWRTPDPQQTLTSSQLKTALAPALLQEIADKTQLPLTQTTEVLAYLVPLIIGQLTACRIALSAPPNDFRRALWSHSNVLPVTSTSKSTSELNVAVARVPKLRQIAAFTKARGAQLLRAFPFL